MYRTVFWTLWERERVGWFERIALKHVYYHMWNRSPVQVRCMRQGAQGWCSGMTLRDGMGREVRGASGWGTHVHPWLIHVNVWEKPLQYCKVISLQLKNMLIKNPIYAWLGEGVSSSTEYIVGTFGVAESLVAKWFLRMSLKDVVRWQK